MKDPLRYYIAEGFVSIFVFPDPQTKRLDYKPLAIAAHLSNFEIEKDTLTVFGPGYETHTYHINDDFLLDYGIVCNTKAEADAKMDEYTTFVTDLVKSFKKILPSLTPAE